MYNKKRLTLYSFLVAIIIIILICTFAVLKADDNSSVEYKMPVYKISISEDTQCDIWKQCEKNKLSYELVLAIYQTEGKNTSKFNNIKEEIENLAYFRDYWTELGFPDEIVFNLMLLSKERGIEGCKTFMKESDSYNLDNYVQKVTEYKYYLEQMNFADIS